MSIGDVMGNASGLGMLGGAVKSDGKGGNKDSGDGKDGNASGSGSSSATGTASGSKSASVPEVLASIRHRRHEPQIAVAEHVV